jgi:hypothetical protein
VYHTLVWFLAKYDSEDERELLALLQVQCDAQMDGQPVFVPGVLKFQESRIIVLKKPILLLSLTVIVFITAAVGVANTNTAMSMSMAMSH